MVTSPSPTPSPTSRFLEEAKALTCVHCGLCLSSCPTYLETGDENDSPRGRIYLMRAVEEGRLPVGGTAVRHIDACLGCRACEAVCPSGVPYGELLEATRDYVEKNHRRSWFQTLLRRVVIAGIFPFPSRMRWALLPARLLRALGLQWMAPKFVRNGLALLPETIRRVPLPELSPAEETYPRARLGFVSGCVMQVLFGETNRASVQLLNQDGYDVYTPLGQGCCGALHAHNGNLDEARRCARHNIAVFERLRLDAVIVNAAGCGSSLKEYGHWLRDDPDWAKRASQFSAQVRDLSEWLTPSDGTAPSDFRAEGRQSEPTVTYHDACHLAHPQRITRAPRALIHAMAGDRLVDLVESDVCCGSAGSYNLTEPAMAERLQVRKVQNILKSGATTVVTTNPGCLLQIQAGLKKAGATHVRALHLADYLVEQRAKAIASSSQQEPSVKDKA